MVARRLCVLEGTGAAGARLRLQSCGKPSLTLQSQDELVSALHPKRPDVAHGVVHSFKVNVSGTRTRSRSSQYPPLWRV
jgi:hypothetical protein